jgi:hypothetical protein
MRPRHSGVRPAWLAFVIAALALVGVLLAFVWTRGDRTDHRLGLGGASDSAVAVAGDSVRARMARELMLMARELRDSSERLRRDLIERRGPLNAAQERRLAQLDQRAKRLAESADRLGTVRTVAADPQRLYRQCQQIYGEGAGVCELLRTDLDSTGK